MTNFFKKVRKKRLSENKFRKYLIYALGEIILVIIGILIALQINKINTVSTHLQESKEFTVRLQEEVRSNIEITNTEIESKKRELSASFRILKMIDGTEIPVVKTLDSLLFICMNHNQIDLNLGTLTEGLNTGTIALIPSHSLRSMLYSFLSIVQTVKENEQINNEDIDYYLMPYLYDHFNFRQMDNANASYKDELGPSKFTEHDNLLMLNDLKFENLIDNRTYQSQARITEYKWLKSKLETLEKLIEEEIKS